MEVALALVGLESGIAPAIRRVHCVMHTVPERETLGKNLNVDAFLS